jgi:hypothetical protein
VSNVRIILTHAFRLRFKSYFLASEWALGSMVTIVSQPSCFCIVEHSFPSPTVRFLVEVCGDLATDSFINSHCLHLVGRHAVLGLYCMLPVVKSLCFRRSSVCFESFLTESFLEILTHLIHNVPYLWAFVCPDTDNSSLYSGVIAPITYDPFRLSSVKKTKLDFAHISGGLRRYYGNPFHNMICSLWLLRSRNIQLLRNHKNMLQVSCGMFVTEELRMLCITS